jgi:acyl phosphate:glycerol-3-phosphate acyltransferase
MPSPDLALFAVVAYLIGAIPFGYLIARMKGIDLFHVGSGNIGATNVGRVLGRKWGILVFVLDFLKGAGPVAAVPALLRTLNVGDELGQVDLLRVVVALSAFAGHLFPLYLWFRGGKGVATGFGAVVVLVPGPAAVAIVVWLSAVVSFRAISVGSLLAAVILVGARLLSVSDPFKGEAVYITAFCVAGTIAVFIKHRANLQRLVAGTENQLEARPMFDFLQRALHLLALALWLGSAVFFSFLAAPKIFASFAEVAKSPPGDRTAYVPINEGLDDARKDQLGSALAGAAVGPIFPLFFGLHGVCGIVALITAAGWWKQPGRINCLRIWLIGAALLTVAIGWPISQKVTDLRLDRFSTDAAVAAAAKDGFVTWHLISLALSFLTTVLVFVAVMLAARLPERRNTATMETQKD